MTSKGLLYLALLATISCTAQKPQVVQHVDAFFQVRVPGIIPEISEGNAGVNLIDTLYVIYIQSDENLPDWKKAWSLNHSFDIEIFKLGASTVSVGFRKSTGEEVRLTPPQGKQFYKLLLKKDATAIKREVTVKNGQLLLQGLREGKDVYYPIRELVELHSPLHE